MSTYTLKGAIAAQKNMVREDIESAKQAFENGDYSKAAEDLAAAIGEMGALAAYKTIKDGTVRTD